MTAPLCIGVLHGPNLNLLGVREPAVYGSTTLDELNAQLIAHGAALGVTVRCAQSNTEGTLIDTVHEWRSGVDGVVVNAGAYAHTSLALRDALVGVSLPFIEVHLSNVFAREPERHHSMLASAAIGVVVGLGPLGYRAAIDALVQSLMQRLAGHR